MTTLLRLFALAFSLALFGCAEPGHYPVTGEECTETDPVLDLDAADCIAPIPASV